MKTISFLSVFVSLPLSHIHMCHPSAYTRKLNESINQSILTNYSKSTHYYDCTPIHTHTCLHLHQQCPKRGRVNERDAHLWKYTFIIKSLWQQQNPFSTSRRKKRARQRSKAFEHICVTQKRFCCSLPKYKPKHAYTIYMCINRQNWAKSHVPNPMQRQSQSTALYCKAIANTHDVCLCAATTTTAKILSTLKTVLRICYTIHTLSYSPSA